MTTPNRLAHLFEGRLVPQYAPQVFNSAWGDVDRAVEPYAHQALLKRLAQLESQLAAHKKELSELHEKVQTYESFERLRIKFASALQGARNLVAAFAYEHREQIKDVILGWADSEFRFLIVSRNEQFDWDLCDDITDLEAALVEDYADVPLSCKCVPGAAENELEAILEAKLGTMKWDFANAVSK